ncbi:MAG TPA: hypothetical protein VFY68_14390 [Nitrososphaeraceae archaeon]|nr:hypothetical protein [Nitrososphaeraceae archaeon]
MGAKFTAARESALINWVIFNLPMFVQLIDAHTYNDVPTQRRSVQNNLRMEFADIDY